MPKSLCLPRQNLAMSFTVSVVFLFAAMAATFASAAPSADLWERWTAHDPASGQTVDHSVWDRLTRTYVTGGGASVAMVRYGEVTPTDRQALDSYIEALEATPVSVLNRDEQFAYWVNFYNALTIKVILDHYPVESIRDIDITPGFFSNGPWGAKLVRIEGEDVSLDDIEHRILRPIWKDPRIHYGVNCASIGCPDLRAGAYTSANLETALDEAAWTFVNHPRGAEVRGGRLYVSSIYDWFEDDFGGNDAGVIAHLKEFAGPTLANRLSGITSVSGDDYDWKLNDPARPNAAADIVRRNQLGGARSERVGGS